MRIFGLGIVLLVGVLSYGLVGTSTRVDEIKQRAQMEMLERGWKTLRYEGYQLGSFGRHGGKVWYHVQNINSPSTQYRVMVTLWNNELHYTYGNPEPLSRLNIEHKSN